MYEVVTGIKGGWRIEKVTPSGRVIVSPTYKYKEYAEYRKVILESQKPKKEKQ